MKKRIDAFRKELLKIMPGYKWTVNTKYANEEYIEATGIMSSGFNRTSTLSVVMRDGIDGKSYEVKSSGYGTRSSWIYRHQAKSLKSALRELQNYYEEVGRTYGSAARCLAQGRKSKNDLPRTRLPN